MKMLNTHYVSWTQFFFYLAIIIGGYLLLTILHRISRNIGYWPWYQRRISKYSRVFMLLYEPISAVVLLALFVLVNPLFHGIVVSVLLISAVSILRSYLSGRILLWDATLVEGLKIITGKKEGVVGKLGRIGIRMKSNEGLQYISYRRLLQDGYMISSGEFAGGYCKFSISLQEGESLEHLASTLKDRLVSSPYIDARHRPEINFRADHLSLEASVLVRHKRHQRELINLVREWGYSPSIIKQ